jgi:hypothetical protein
MKAPYAKYNVGYTERFTFQSGMSDESLSLFSLWGYRVKNIPVSHGVAACRTEVSVLCNMKHVLWYLETFRV